jgi:hypothetical protein
MPTISSPHNIAAVTRTCKQVAIPCLTAKPTHLCRLIWRGLDPARAEKTSTKPVTLVIGINKVEATSPVITEAHNNSVPVQMLSATALESKPKRKVRKAATLIAPLPPHERKWITVKEAAALYPKSEQAFRHLIHQSSRQARYPDASLPSFGFEKCVLRQPGSRNVYLLVEELDRWMAQGQGGVQ